MLGYLSAITISQAKNNTRAQKFCKWLFHTSTITNFSHNISGMQEQRMQPSAIIMFKELISQTPLSATWQCAQQRQT